MAAATHALTRAPLALAESEGYVRLFVDEGEPMHLLLQTLASDDFHLTTIPSQASVAHLAAYTNKIIAAFPGQPPPSAALEARSVTQVEVQNPNQNLVEPLSQRELEVLRLFRGRSLECGHRRTVDGLGRHRQNPPQTHLRQTRRTEPHPGCCAGAYPPLVISVNSPSNPDKPCNPSLGRGSKPRRSLFRGTTRLFQTSILYKMLI